MLISTPTVSWEALITETTPNGIDFNFTCRVSKVNANDPGYGLLEVGYFIVDFIGHLFEIKEINYGGDSTIVRCYDVTENTHSFGPYNDRIGYIYNSIDKSALLTQAKINRLDKSAEDYIRNLISPRTCKAENVSVDITDFTNNLGSDDVDVQTALETLDALTISALYQPDGTNAFVYTDNNGNLHIDGNIYQNGSTYETHAEQLYTQKDIIITRDGATVGLSAGEFTGIQAKLYDGTNDGQLVFDNTGVARVGDVGSLQPLATREENPINGYFAMWDSANNRFNTVENISSQWITSGSNIYYNGGNVTIGSVSSVERLQVFNLESTNFHAEPTIGLSSDRSDYYSAIGTYRGWGSKVIGLSFFTTNAGALTNRMTIAPNGNVRIGTTTDSGYKLDVNGTGRFANEVTASSFIKQGGTSSQFLKADGSVDSHSYLTSYSELWNANNDNIYYNNGNVTVGSTDFESKLNVEGDIKAYDNIISNELGVFSKGVFLGYNNVAASAEYEGVMMYEQGYCNGSTLYSRVKVCMRGSNDTFVWKVIAQNLMGSCSTAGSGGGCFLAGTKITMDNNTFKNIEDIKIDDKLLTYDEINKKIITSKVKKIFIHTKNNTKEWKEGYYIIKTQNNNKINVTGNHPIYTIINNKETYVRADKLKINDLIRIYKNNIALIDKIISIQFIKENIDVVYNLEVSNTHNYFANNILVHNKCDEVYTFDSPTYGNE